MKLSEIQPIVEADAVGLKALGLSEQSAALKVLATLFGEFGAETMARLVARAGHVDPAEGGGDGGGATARVVRERLEQLAALLAAAGAKGALVRDVQALAKMLRRFGESETLQSVTTRLRDAMQPTEMQIARFIERLKKDTGTAAFERTFSELVASPLKKEEVVEIALSVYGGIKKSTSRKGALEFIRKPHDAFVSAKKGIDATNGRSAA